MPSANLSEDYKYTYSVAFEVEFISSHERYHPARRELRSVVIHSSRYLNRDEIIRMVKTMNKKSNVVSVIVK